MISEIWGITPEACTLRWKISPYSPSETTLPGCGRRRLVDADQRAARAQGQVHDLDDLLAVNLTEAAAEDRRVLREHAHVATVDGAVAGDDTVADRAVVGQTEVGAAVPREGVEFDERASSSRAWIRSRAVSLPFAWTFSMAASPLGAWAWA